jgi:hypothetical protein
MPVPPVLSHWIIGATVLAVGALTHILSVYVSPMVSAV